MTLKMQIGQELQQHTTQWFTVEQLIAQMGIAKDRYETAARALRKLREEGHVQARWCQRSRRYREWSSSNSNPGQQVVPATRQPVTQTSPAALLKGGARRSPMCTPTNQPTLVQAIKDVVAEFVKSERTFSAYDVTTELRSRANDGKVTIDSAETGTVHVGGKNVPKVEHETIKGIVHDLHSAGELGSYSRTHNGKYWEYELTDDSTDAADDNVATANPGPVVAVVAVSTGDDYDGSPTL